MIQKGSIVTVDLVNSSSNTFIVDTVEESTVLVTHPLAKDILMRVAKDKVDTTSANIKDSSERGIDYANQNRQYLDYNSTSDLEAIGIYFALKRKLTPGLKRLLSGICGVIAKGKFNDDIRATMTFVTKNSFILDEFNSMWYTSFSGIFSGTQIISSKKQRDVIFNIAGYILAEMENPTAKTRK